MCTWAKQVPLHLYPVFFTIQRFCWLFPLLFLLGYCSGLLLVLLVPVHIQDGVAVNCDLQLFSPWANRNRGAWWKWQSYARKKNSTFYTVKLMHLQLTWEHISFLPVNWLLNVKGAFQGREKRERLFRPCWTVDIGHGLCAFLDTFLNSGQHRISKKFNCLLSYLCRIRTYPGWY